ncbi:Cytochrome P450 [Plasmopara halstedii]|uniref:Cytochrome P450 n=1 Tax=Plasmopara halstedii TaxID=4781 RepID=A0A0P1AFH1_PLAHL|nr:Cytochrome P450 [Plasmopara halstedii]CEG39149.1 Cytochrome P450 [Plasmopara halstedii]|eukprot:XP_024575518.1 Cytochrome P450 [Plasmopara halstedii]
MTLNALLHPHKLVPISPTSLLSSTLALVVFWAMRQGRQRQLSWTSIPKPPRGEQNQLNRSSNLTIPRVKCVEKRLKEGSAAFYEWMVSLSLRFHGKPWLLQRSGRPDVMILTSPLAFEDIQRTFAMQFDKLDSKAEGLVHDVHGKAIVEVGTDSFRSSAKIQRWLATSVVSSPLLSKRVTEIVKQHLQWLLKNLDDTNLDSNVVSKLMRQFATKVFIELGFGLQKTSEFEDALEDIERCIAERRTRPMIMWKLERLFNVGSEAALRHSVDVLSAITSDAVNAKKRNHGTRIRNQCECILDILSQKCSSKLSKDANFLANYVLSLVVAARDSTAQTLTKCLECLTHHVEEQDKIRIDLNVAREKCQDVHSVVRLDAVVKETLRLYPVYPFIRRRATCDTVLSDGTFVAKGMEVMMDLYTMARREDVWGSDCAEFRPQRWIDRTSGKLRPVSSYKFNAFLGGPRSCVGGNIALKEIKTVLASIYLCRPNFLNEILAMNSTYVSDDGSSTESQDNFLYEEIDIKREPLVEEFTTAALPTINTKVPVIETLPIVKTEVPNVETLPSVKTEVPVVESAGDINHDNLKRDIKSELINTTTKRCSTSGYPLLIETQAEMLDCKSCLGMLPRSSFSKSQRKNKKAASRKCHVCTGNVIRGPKSLERAIRKKLKVLSSTSRLSTSKKQKQETYAVFVNQVGRLKMAKRALLRKRSEVSKLKATKRREEYEQQLDKEAKDLERRTVLLKCENPSAFESLMSELMIKKPSGEKNKRKSKSKKETRSVKRKTEAQSKQTEKRRKTLIADSSTYVPPATSIETHPIRVIPTRSKAKTTKASDGATEDCVNFAFSEDFDKN